MFCFYCVHLPLSNLTISRIMLLAGGISSDDGAIARNMAPKRTIASSTSIATGLESDNVLLLDHFRR